MPSKRSKMHFTFQPIRCVRFQISNQVRQPVLGLETDQKVNMVEMSTDTKRCRVEFCQNSSQISVQPSSDLLRQHGPPTVSRENKVSLQLVKGICHEIALEKSEEKRRILAKHPVGYNRGACSHRASCHRCVAVKDSSLGRKPQVNNSVDPSSRGAATDLRAIYRRFAALKGNWMPTWAFRPRLPSIAAMRLFSTSLKRLVSLTDARPNTQPFLVRSLGAQS